MRKHGTAIDQYLSKCLSHSCICIETVKHINKFVSVEPKHCSTMPQGPLGGRTEMGSEVEKNLQISASISLCLAV